MSWRDEEYFRRWEQVILVKLRNTVSNSNCDDIYSSEECFTPKVELKEPVCIKFKKTISESGSSVKKVKEF